MGIPQVTITKTSGNTGATRPSNVGILAAIASAPTGTQNLGMSFARQADLLSTFQGGSLVDWLAYSISVSGKPVIAIRPTLSTAAAYVGLVTSGVVGTSVVTTGPAAPIDDFTVTFTVVTGGTIGVAGITYTYSLDGVNTSAVQALGTANNVTFNMPASAGGFSSGVELAFAAGTLLAGDVVTVRTTYARPNSSDVTTALEALRIMQVPWEAVIVDGDVSVGPTVAALDTWLAGLEATGKFRMAFLNTRHKNLPVPATETEANYLTAMTTVANGQTRSNRVCVGADAADMISPVSGLTMFRPISIYAAATAMSVPIGQDLGWVGAGSITNLQVADVNGNPKWHNEDLYPGLDALGYTTARTVNGQTGDYLTNGNIFSNPGSDYVFVQHTRIMNRACEIAFAQLTQDLGLGVGKQPPDPVTKQIYILEKDAQAIDQSVTTAVLSALKGNVVDARFILSRTDDLSPNSGATVHGELQIEALAYIKGIAVTAKFVKSISIGS